MRPSRWRPAGGWLLWGTVLGGLLIIGVSTVVTLAVARHGNHPVTPAAVTSTVPALNPAKQHASTRPPHPHATPARTFRTPVYVPPPTPVVTPARSPSPLRTAATVPASTTARASTAAPVTATCLASGCPLPACYASCVNPERFLCVNSIA